MKKVPMWMALATILGFAAITTQFARAQTQQTLTPLYSFCAQNSCGDGNNPEAGLIQAGDGNLYGTTESGGASGHGTVFKITPDGTLTTLYRFCAQANCADGYEPLAGLIQATDGNLYGTTYYGGANSTGCYGASCGTVFRITPSGTLTTIYNFCSLDYCVDGMTPRARLIQATDGNLYGTSESGGANGYGTVFKITPSGTLTTLYSFCSQANCADGSYPEAGLVQATDGNLYGTTDSGGSTPILGRAGGWGTIFKITPNGTLTTLYSFCSQANCADGTQSDVELIQATDGNLYGTTKYGGANGDGTAFRITPSGTLTTLYSFCSQTNCTDGNVPFAGLIQATDGNLYGTTAGGGSNDKGTVFAITTDGIVTTLYSFCSQNNCADGFFPWATLVQSINGSLYGTTYYGGANGNGSSTLGGTIFTMSLMPTVTPNIIGKIGTNDWYISKTTTLGWTITGVPTPTTSGCGSVSVPQTTGTTYTCSATNSRGSASKSITIKEDSVKPSVVVKKPSANAVYALNQKVLASYSCLDATSGVATCSGIVTNGASINTSTLGQQTFSVTGTDNAGNTLTKTVLYTVEPGTATPTFSLKTGTYTGPQQVSISDATTGAVIYYTTNGNTPSLSSRVYTSPITIKSTTTLKARAIASNDAWSTTKSATYTIN